MRPDRFGPSHRRVLTASAALPRADGPRALEQATAELIGAELRNPEVQGLRFDLWAHDLIESARSRVLSDVAWNNGTSQGPWWLLHGLASIGSYGLGGYAAQQAAEAAKSLPRAVLAQQPDWLASMPDIEATGDVHVLRDVYGTRFMSRLHPQSWNRSHSLGNGDGQRTNPGHIRLLQGIEPDNNRSEGDKHLSKPRYSSCQRHVSGTQIA